MPPVFGPSSPSNARLWSCAIAIDAASRAVAEHEQRDLGPGEALFDHARAAGVAERVAREVRAHRIARFADRLGDDHALAGREPVGLDDVEPGQRARGTRTRRPRRPRRTSRSGRSGHRPRRSTSFIQAFEPSSRAAAARGPNARRPRGLDRVDDARDQRIFGADDDEVGVELVGEVGAPRRDRSRRPRRTHRSSPCPGCPGAQTTSSTNGERANPHASACSRPPIADDENAAATSTATRRAATRSSDRARDRHRRCSRARR